jgi:hypothetical protein
MWQIAPVASRRDSEREYVAANPEMARGAWELTEQQEAAGHTEQDN